MDLPSAARELGVSPATVRRWLRQGAPSECPGSPGRGHTAIVDPQALAAWRRRRSGLEDTGTTAYLLERIGAALLDCFLRDNGDGRPAHREHGVSDGAAAVLYVATYLRLERSLAGDNAPRYPAAVERLLTVVRAAAENERR